MKNKKKYNIGIIGLTAGSSWANFAHLPAITAQPEKFEIKAVANSKLESSQAAAEACNIPYALSGAEELVNSPEVDIAVVTVRVPLHKEVVTKAIEAGKVIYCEWPLGKDLAEAEELTKFAQKKNVRTFIGTQALRSPAILRLKELINEQIIGEILSHSMIGYGLIWGPVVTDEAKESYWLDKENGVTMLTIPVAHTLAAVQSIFGKFGALTSVLDTRRKKIYSQERDGYLDMTAPDEVGIQAVMEDGSIFSLHYRGGMAPDGNGLTWEINGTKGVIRVTGRTGSIQVEELNIYICLDGETEFRPVDIPSELATLLPGQPIPGNVARMYELMYQDLINDTHDAPDFSDAVELHHLLDRIEKASTLRG